MKSKHARKQRGLQSSFTHIFMPEAPTFTGVTNRAARTAAAATASESGSHYSQDRRAQGLCYSWSSLALSLVRSLWYVKTIRTQQWPLARLKINEHTDSSCLVGTNFFPRPCNAYTYYYYLLPGLKVWRNTESWSKKHNVHAHTYRRTYMDLLVRKRR